MDTFRNGRLEILATIPKWLADHRLLYQQVIIITGVLVLSAGLAYKLPPRYFLFVMAAPVAVVGGLMLLHWPPLGFIGLIVASAVVPFSIPGFGLAATIMMGLVGLWILDMIGSKKRLSLPRSRTVYPLIAFLVVTILAFGFGQLPWYPVAPAPLDGQIRGVLIFFLSFCAYFMVAYYIDDIRWLQGMVYAFIAVAVFFVIGRLVPPIGNIAYRLYRADVVGGSLFWLWLVTLSLSQALFNRKLGLPWRAILGGIAAMTLYVALFRTRQWTSGWFPAVIATGVIVLVGAPRVAFYSALGGGAVLLFKLQDLLNEFVYIGDNDYSAMTRVEAWRIVGEIIKVNPLFGVGPANYKPYTALYPILGWYVQFNSHNNYVDIVAQTGILGLICFFWFFWEVARLGWRLRGLVPEGGFEHAYVIGALGGTAAMMVAAFLGDWVLPFVYNVNMRGMRASLLGWLFLGGLMVIEQIHVQKNGRSASS